MCAVSASNEPNRDGFFAALANTGPILPRANKYAAYFNGNLETRAALMRLAISAARARISDRYKSAPCCVCDPAPCWFMDISNCTWIRTTDRKSDYGNAERATSRRERREISGSRRIPKIVKKESDIQSYILSTPEYFLICPENEMFGIHSCNPIKNQLL